MFVPRSEPRLNTYRAFTTDESPMATPTYHRAAKSAAPIPIPAPVVYAPVNWTTPMLHLNTDGYPTRALYYLHKRLLDVIIHPPTPRTFILTTPPLSPLYSPREPNTSLEIDLDEGEDEDTSKLIHVTEQTQLLQHLCATIISRDYIRPPTPPVGQSPCHTPPRFDVHPHSIEYDETASRVARLLVQSNSCDVEDVDMLDMFEVELELELEAATPKAVDTENYPVVHRKTLLEEMEGVATPKTVKVPTPEEKRKEKQAKRRARNSLNGTRALMV